MRRSKLYKKQVEVAGFDAQKRYSVSEAIALLKGMPGVKFDQTAEVAFKLGVDPRKSDQTVRGAVALPRGTGKTVRVAVVADGALAQDARDAGADFVGYEDIVEKIKGGWQDFDMLIATPDAMRLVRPLGRQLGPRGLMPNPKTGTVTDQVGTAVREAKAGRAEFRADRGACVHVPFGKMSFEADALKENFDVIVEALLKGMPGVTFDQTAEVAFKLGVDPRKSDQTVRGAVALPRGTGKTVRVAVVADGPLAQDARDAGADFVGYEDIVEKIKGGWQDFDILIATPDAMRLVRPLGRQLGPRGLMPNPKTGTVTDQVGTAVREAKAGRAEFRADRGACVHVPFGKMSFEADALKENFDVIVDALNKAKPTTAKGAYILSCTISATMTPGVKINVKELVRSKE